VQEQAGLDLLSDGMLGWQDLFRPLAEGVDGLDARPLTRFLDTNTFYRAVLVDGEPHLRAPLPPPDLPAGRWLGTLPSPYAFARAADGRVSAQAVAADVLSKQIEAWGEAGCALIVLSEPFLAREGEAGEAIRALEELPDAVPLALQLVFGDASRLLDELADAPLAAVCGLLPHGRGRDPGGLSEGDSRRRRRFQKLGARRRSRDRPVRGAAPAAKSGRDLARPQW
jgi:5-methyltetrahydropteroyltriglutamate--homocysteine methyltransferase